MYLSWWSTQDTFKASLFHVTAHIFELFGSITIMFQSVEVIMS